MVSLLPSGSSSGDSKVSSEIALSSDVIPNVNPNIPSPKDVVGKVKVKTISCKTQVRYRSSENPTEFKDCDPQYKITRYWNASVSLEEPAERQITYEDNKPIENASSCNMSVDSKLSHVSLVSWSSMSLYEKALITSFSVDSINEEKDSQDPRFVRLSSPLRQKQAYHVNSKGSTSEFQAQCVNQKFQKSSSVPAICINQSDHSQQVSSREISASHGSLAESRPSPFFYSSRNISIADRGVPQTKIKNSYSLSIPCSTFEQIPFEEVGFEEIPYEEAAEMPEPQNEDSVNMCRTVIVEKKLQYVMENDPGRIRSPKTLTRKFSTMESVDAQCRHTCYFTGIGRVGFDVLQDISIFGVDKYDRNRIETRLRTTILSESNGTYESGENDMKSFIERHNIDDDISHSFNKLGDDQIHKDDPSVIRVAEVVTVAEMNTIDPEELFKEKR